MKKLIVFFTLVLFADVAHASYISMETKTTAVFEEDTLTVTVDVTNKGDEPAYNVQVGIDANENVATTPVQDILSINEVHKAEKSFKMDIEKEGRYPLIITVDYTDRNQYPFSAISSAYFVYKEDVSPKMHGKINEVVISKSGKINLALKNLLDTDKKVRVKLIAPRELSVVEDTKEVDLGSKSEKDVGFEVSNFSALPGSSYQVFAVMGYDDNDKHCTITVPGIVKIIARKDFFRTYKWVFIGVGVALLAVFLGLQFGVRKPSANK